MQLCKNIGCEKCLCGNSHSCSLSHWSGVWCYHEERSFMFESLFVNYRQPYLKRLVLHKYPALHKIRTSQHDVIDYKRRTPSATIVGVKKEGTGVLLEFMGIHSDVTQSPRFHVLRFSSSVRVISGDNSSCQTWSVWCCKTDEHFSAASLSPARSRLILIWHIIWNLNLMLMLMFLFTKELVN